MRQKRFCILMLSVSCLAAFPAWAQQSTRTPPDKGESAQPKSSTASSKEKSALAEATRVSTAETARKAAKAAAEKRGSTPASEASGAPDVLEFSPAAQDSVGAAATEESKKSALKNVHGDAYGALDSRGDGKRAGGSVGATSKSGKSSIYVETDRSHETTTTPH